MSENTLENLENKLENTLENIRQVCFDFVENGNILITDIRIVTILTQKTTFEIQKSEI